MNVINTLTEEINKLEDSSNLKIMYDSLRTQLIILCESVAKVYTSNKISDLVERIEYYIDIEPKEYIEYPFFTFLDNGEKCNLLKFQLYQDHFEIHKLFKEK